MLETLTGARRGAATATSVDRAAGAPAPAGSTRSTGGGGRWPVGAVVMALLVPVAAAVVALRTPRWYPTLDYAMTELRVRDVPTGEAPLVGLAGRLHAEGVQGSHPGPLSFWVLWPAYRVLGASAWALQVATAVVNLVAMAVALWIADRRAGRAGVVAAGCGLALLAHGLGVDRLTEPWNPYLPVLWWVVLLLALWSVLCDDVALGPVAVFAGSFCAQTHVPYLGTVASLLGGAAVVVAVRARRGPPGARRRAGRWGAASAGLLALLWLPPVVEQRRRGLGNLSIIRHTFSDPPQPPLGLSGRAVDVWLSSLDPLRVPRYTRSFAEMPQGSTVAGAFLVGLWLVALVAARPARAQDRSLWSLHLVVAAAVALGLVSITRIHGPVFQYLTLWARATTAVLVAATVWTAVAVVGRRPGGRPAWLPAAGGVALALAVAISSVDLTLDAADAVAPDPVESDVVARVAPDTIAALRSGDLPGGGADGRYVVRWVDTLSILPAGYGFLLELERGGLDVGAPAELSTNVVPHRVRAPDEATATVLLVRGEPMIEAVRAAALPGSGVHEVASSEPRTPAQVARAAVLRASVARGLDDAGLSDVRPLLDDRTMMVAFDERLPGHLVADVDEIVRMGAPLAVFVGPAGEAWMDAIDPRLTGW